MPCCCRENEMLLRKFLAEIICQTVNLRNFTPWNHSGNRLNGI